MKLNHESHPEIIVNLPNFDSMITEIIKQTTILKEYFQLNFIYYQLVSGHGLEFDSIKRYNVGDDIRRIDWKKYAKKQELYTRVFEEERQYNIIIVVDVSDTMLLGTTKHTKTEYASIVAGVIANAANESSDLTALVMTSDKVDIATNLSNDYSEFITFLTKQENYGGKKDWAKMLNSISSNYSEESIIFILSDFIDSESLEEVIPDLCLKFSKVYGIMIRDPTDIELPDNVGQMYLREVHVSKTHLIDLDQAKEEYKLKTHEEIEKMTDLFHNSGQYFFSMNTKQEFAKSFVIAMGNEKVM